VLASRRFGVLSAHLKCSAQKVLH